MPPEHSLRKDMPVVDANGAVVGRVRRPEVAAAARDEVAFFTVELHGAPQEERLVPYEAILNLDEQDRLHVGLPLDGMRRAPPYAGRPPSESEASAALHGIWNAKGRRQGVTDDPTAAPRRGEDLSSAGPAARAPAGGSSLRLEEGMPVLGRDGRKLGEVGKVIVGQTSREARFFTIEMGLVFHHEMLVPREAIAHVDVAGAAHVDLNQDQLRAMPPYDGDPPTGEEARQAYQALGARVGGDYVGPAGRQHELTRPAYEIPQFEPYGFLPEDERERERYHLEWSYGPVGDNQGQGF